jgi:hypothetical protein
MENMENTVVVEGTGAAVVAQPTAEELALQAAKDALVAPGKKGVTNAQMIPAMKKFLIENDTESLAKLKEYFPGVYASSTKYLGKENIAKLEALNIA